MIQWTSQLRDLVLLRNRIVHMFSDEHEICSIEGCDRALAFLKNSDVELETYAAAIVEWASVVDVSRAQAARLLANLHIPLLASAVPIELSKEAEGESEP